MASIHREITIGVPAGLAWDAMRDVGALPTRLVAGFVMACTLEGDSRIVSFANGVVARERIVTVDDAARRLVWAAVSERLSHHNASAQVFDDGPQRCRVVWIADLLPDGMEAAIRGMIEQGLQAMRRTLEGAAIPVAGPR